MHYVQLPFNYNASCLITISSYRIIRYFGVKGLVAYGVPGRNDRALQQPNNGTWYLLQNLAKKSKTRTYRRVHYTNPGRINEPDVQGLIHHPPYEH